jgi:hypothetical protein
MAATARVGELDRRAIRQVFEKRFTCRTMAQRYVAIYDKLDRSRRAALREVAA